jgi:hypothetical protein
MGSKPLIRYHEKLGLTQDEFEQMKEGMLKGRQYVTVGEETLKIFKTDSLIHFSGSGDISAIDSLIIDRSNRQVRFGSTVIPYEGEVHADDQTVVKAWAGHVFSLEETNTTNLSQLDEMDAKSYRLMFGKTQRDNKSYLYFEAKEVNKGEVPVSIEFGFFF